MTTRNNIEIDLVKIEELSRLREKENIRFRSYLKGQDSDKIDSIVHRLNQEISAQIDCTSCGNCCSKLKPCITDEDILRLSQRLAVAPEQIKEDYTETDDDEDEGKLYFKNLPCSFLKDRKCSIYNDRPEDCISFPHLHKEEFTSRLWSVINNYSICPIVFNVFERLKTKLNFR